MDADMDEITIKPYGYECVKDLGHESMSLKEAINKIDSNAQKAMEYIKKGCLAKNKYPTVKHPSIK